MFWNLTTPVFFWLGIIYILFNHPSLNFLFIYKKNSLLAEYSWVFIHLKNSNLKISVLQLQTFTTFTFNVIISVGSSIMFWCLFSVIPISPLLFFSSFVLPSFFFFLDFFYGPILMCVFPLGVYSAVVFMDHTIILLFKGTATLFSAMALL